eukprot:scaffold42976_cov199-Amphora_coffeaeformis.AAC.2
MSNPLAITARLVTFCIRALVGCTSAAWMGKILNWDRNDRIIMGKANKISAKEAKCGSLTVSVAVWLSPAVISTASSCTSVSSSYLNSARYHNAAQRMEIEAKPA